MSWLKGLMDKASTQQQVSVPTLVQRIQDAASREDKKKAIADLKNVSDNADTSKDIGSAIPVLINALKTERQDIDSVKGLLQIFVNIMTVDKEQRKVPPESVAYKNVEKFVEDAHNIPIVLTLLEESDKNVRYLTAKLLAILLANNAAPLQHAVLHTPMGIAHLTDLLRTNSDLIRNEGLLLLTELTRSNQEIQKIVAFEGGFDRLLDIMDEEQMNQGGVVVVDCIVLLIALLTDNPSNQNLFREMGCIERLPPLYEVEKGDMWLLTENKAEILYHALRLLIALLSSTSTNAYGFQTAFNENKILDHVMKLALGGLNSPRVRLLAMRALALLLRGHVDNSHVFETTRYDSEVLNKQAQPAVVKLLLIIFHAPLLAERHAALGVLSAYLTENGEAQRALATTVTPLPDKASEVDEEACGRMLMHVLDGDAAHEEQGLKIWFSAVIFAAILRNNALVKELLLKIPLEDSEHRTADNLLSKTVKLLIKAFKTRAAVPVQLGLLRMIATWLDDCDPAVTLFMNGRENISTLVDVINQPSTNMHVAGLSALVCGLCLPLEHVTAERGLIQELVTTNITIDRYLDRLDQVRRSDEFTRAQHRVLQHTSDDDTVQHWYDFEFTLLFNRTYDKIVRRLRPNQVTSASASTGGASVSQEQHQMKIDQYKELLLAQDKQLVDLRRRYEESEKRVAQLGQELNAYKIKSPQLGTSDSKLKEELERREREIVELKSRVQSLEQKTPNQGAPNDDQFLELRRLRQENEELKRVREENKVLQSRVSQLERDKQSSALSDSNLEVLSKRVKELTAELTESKEQYEALAVEQEELLVCLARAEMEKNDLKAKLGITDDDEGEGDEGEE